VPAAPERTASTEPQLERPDRATARPPRNVINVRLSPPPGLGHGRYPFVGGLCLAALPAELTPSRPDLPICLGIPLFFFSLPPFSPVRIVWTLRKGRFKRGLTSFSARQESRAKPEFFASTTKPVFHHTNPRGILTKIVRAPNRHRQPHSKIPMRCRTANHSTAPLKDILPLCSDYYSNGPP